MLRRSCPVPGTRRPPWHARLTAAALRPTWRALSGQAAAPHGPIGRLLARNWVRETAAVNDTAVHLLAPVAGERVLEIGFGPGRTLARLAAAGADVIGIDTSPAMVAAAARRNATHVAAGRVQLHHGDAAILPVPDHSLDGTIYRVPTTLEAEQWLTAAGFTDVRCEQRPDVAPATVWLVASTTCAERGADSRAEPGRAR